MGFQDAMDALHLKMPKRIPRTEYSASGHWDLIRAVTGRPVFQESSWEEKSAAAAAFEKAWDFGFTWNISTYHEIFGDQYTKMGHAVYAAGGTDFNMEISCPFSDEEQVYQLDLFELYGTLDQQAQKKVYEENYRQICAARPDQVNMTGIYVTMVSGMLEILGWDLFLTALGADYDRFCSFTDRYADWILQYFQALAASDVPVVMIHDDIVWTSGAFARRDWYLNHVFANYEKLFEPLHKAGKIILYTSDGDYTEFIDDIAACGINGFVMEPCTDMAYIAKHYGKTHAFVGNADCRILTYGTKEEIRREVERCVAIGKEYPGFFMAVGNHIPANVPVENALYYNQVFESMRER